MPTKLQNELRRELTIGGKQFVVTISPLALKLVGKGRRKGLEIQWEDLISGDAALATALNASLDPGLHLEPAGRGSRPAREKKRRVKTVATRSSHGGARKTPGR